MCQNIVHRTMQIMPLEILATLPWASALHQNIYLWFKESEWSYCHAMVCSFGRKKYFWLWCWWLLWLFCVVDLIFICHSTRYSDCRLVLFILLNNLISKFWATGKLVQFLKWHFLFKKWTKLCSRVHKKTQQSTKVHHVFDTVNE